MLGVANVGTGDLEHTYGFSAFHGHRYRPLHLSDLWPERTLGEVYRLQMCRSMAEASCAQVTTVSLFVLAG